MKSMSTALQYCLLKFTRKFIMGYTALKVILDQTGHDAEIEEH